MNSPIENGILSQSFVQKRRRFAMLELKIGSSFLKNLGKKFPRFLKRKKEPPTKPPSVIIVVVM